MELKDVMSHWITWFLALITAVVTVTLYIANINTRVVVVEHEHIMYRDEVIQRLDRQDKREDDFSKKLDDLTQAIIQNRIPRR